MSIRHFFNYRPLSVLAIAGGARDILLGFGFLSGIGEITRTLIFQNYDELIPGYTGPLMGILFVLVGLGVIVTALKYDRKWLNVGLRFQALAWLFTTLMYCLNGNFLLAAIFGLLCSFPAGYIAFYVKNHPAIDEQMKSLLRGT